VPRPDCLIRSGPTRAEAAQISGCQGAPNRRIEANGSRAPAEPAPACARGAFGAPCSAAQSRGEYCCSQNQSDFVFLRRTGMAARVCPPLMTRRGLAIERVRDATPCEVWRQCYAPTDVPATEAVAKAMNAAKPNIHAHNSVNGATPDQARTTSRCDRSDSLPDVSPTQSLCSIRAAALQVVVSRIDRCSHRHSR
jgi:hypothetical protein